MRYAISNWIYADEPLTESFARLALLRYEGIELVGEPERYSAEQVNALSAEHGIAVTSILSWCIWGIEGRDLASQDNDERAAAIRYGRQCIDLARDVGAPIVVLIPAPAGRMAPSAFSGDAQAWEAAYQNEWQLAVDSVRQTAAYAEEQGILIAVEPINRYETFLVTNLEQGKRFLQDVGAQNIKLHLDTFHMNIEEANLADAVRRAGDLLVSMHVSDSNREAPGRGHIDFGALLQTLHEIDFRGPLALEPVPPGSDPLLAVTMTKNLPLRDTYAEEGIRHLRAIEASLTR